MLKHNDIISALTDIQKIRILTDINALADAEIASLGVPHFDISYLRREIKGEYPSPQAQAHSWDPELARAVARASGAADGNSHLVITPGAKIRFSPYRNEISEDPYLASRLAGAYAEGVADTGAGACLSGYYITGEDADWLDSECDERVLYEYIVAPYADAALESGAISIMTDNRALPGDYDGANARLRDTVLQRGKFSGAIAVAERVADDELVSFIARGGICLAGSSLVLETAYNKYKKLKKSVENGNLTMGDLDTEIYEGRAISPEHIDSALDRLLDVVFRCKCGEAGASRRERDATAYRAAEESIVLLKNEGAVLPLKNINSVALIGDIINGYERGGYTMAERFEAGLLDLGCPTVYKSDGYITEADRDFTAKLPTDAFSLCRRCDAVLLFLGHSQLRGKNIPGARKESLPANQLLLAKRLSELGKKVVVIIESGYGVDMAFAEPFSAVLLAPLGVKYDSEAILNVLTGEANPSGRLAYTLYSGLDDYERKHKVYRDKWGTKTGRLIGYRYYTKAGVRTGYPFGHGLSYSKVTYSDLAVEGGTVRFNLTNTSGEYTREVAEVYIGIRNSAEIRPDMELCAFKGVPLAPHETKTVTLDMKIPELYDRESGELVREIGDYNVYVGPTSEDIRLTAAVYLSGRKVKSDGEELYRYIQSKSNIIEDNYTLEAKHKPMNKSLKNIVCGISSVILAICLGVYNSLTESSAFVGIVAGILAVAGAAFFALELYEKNKAYKEERERIDKENEKHFEDAEKLPEFSADKMFADEFDVVDEETAAREIITRDDGTVDESLKYIDKSLDFATAASELTVFARERGLSIDELTAKKIFASVAASRLVVFKDMPSEIFKTLVVILSEYFDTQSYIDTVDETYTDEASMLFGTDDEGIRIKKNLTSAIEAASGTSYGLYIAALDGVRCGNMLSYFTPFAKYSKNPIGFTAVSAHNEWDKEATYYIPRNMWFFANLAEGECYDEIPGYVADIATVNTFDIQKCAVSEEHTGVRKFRFYQIDYLSERAGGAFGIPEDAWKKIDKLEDFVNTHEAYHIENKLSLSLERYAAALLSSGVEAPDAVDCAMETKLIPTVIPVLFGKIAEDERGISETLDVLFGEDSLPRCRAVIKNSEEFNSNNKIAEAAEEEAADETDANVENVTETSDETDANVENVTETANETDVNVEDAAKAADETDTNVENVAEATDTGNEDVTETTDNED